MSGTSAQAYCKRAAGNKRRLAQTLPNTLRRALAIPLKGRKTAAPGLAKFATELLQLPLGQQHQDQEQGQRPEVNGAAPASSRPAASGAGAGAATR
eukprot:1158508-Pelagomonas_calceolata.AAC.44